MTVKMQVRVLALLLLGVAGGVYGHDEDCPPEPADYSGLAACGVFGSEGLLAKLGISEAEVEREMIENSNGDLDEMNLRLEALRAEAEADDAQAVMEASEKAVAGETAASTSLILDVQSYYRPVCPKRYYWLARFRWYFYVNYQGTYQYCFAYYPVWVNTCLRNYCAWWFTNPYLSYYYYRCFPVYRVFYVWSRCLTYTTDSTGQVTWNWYTSNRYVRIYVPRDCCCRRYLNPWITAATCVATPQ